MPRLRQNRGMDAFVSIYITAASAAEADTIAQVLVEERLAACVNILPGIRSIYRWEGRVQEDAEVALIAKSRADLFDTLCDRVKTLHSSSCPCIVAWPIAAGFQPYLDWLAEETKQDK